MTDQSPAWNEIPLGSDVVLFRDGSRDIHILDPAAYWVWDSRKSGLGAGDIKTLLNRAEADVPLTAEQVDHWFERWERSESDAGRREPETTGMRGPGITALEWPPPRETMRYQFSDVSVRVRYGNSDLYRLGQQVLGHLAAGGPSSTKEVNIGLYTRGGRIVVETRCRRETFDDLDDALSHLVFLVVESVIAATPRRVTLHASAVSCGDLGIVLPGSSGSGKSTLAAALSRHGFTYLADDVVPIVQDSDQLVPVPVAMCLKQGSWEPAKIGDAVPAHRRLGRRVKYLAPPSVRVEPLDRYVVVCPVYEEEAAEARVSGMTPVELLAELVRSESVLEKEMSRAYMSGIVDWVQSVPAYRLRYGDTHEAISRINEVIGGFG